MNSHKLIRHFYFAFFHLLVVGLFPTSMIV
nr:MAG TPA: hypothetical protein [Caudoviricetes sp.]